MLAKSPGFNPKGPYLSLEKEKETFCVVLTYSIKWTREIRKFHVAVMQQRLKNVQKSMMHAQSCFFANLNVLFVCCSPLLLPLPKLLIVVIQKFCYLSNMTSHFSSLFITQSSPKVRDIMTSAVLLIWWKHNYILILIITQSLMF